MKNYKIIKTDFLGSYKKLKQNSVLFENISVKTPYCDKDAKFIDDSIYGLNIFDNPLITDRLDDIKMNSDLQKFETDDVSDYGDITSYYYNPELFCYDFMDGYTQYWYILLAVNGYNTKFEFTDFTELLVPRTEYIKSLLIEYDK